MLRLRSLLLACASLGLVPASASAAVPHTVAPGETLWTIASASNLTTRALAAYNGLDPEGHVVLGSTIMVPSESEAAAAMTAAGMLPAPPPAAGPAPTAAPAAASADAPPTPPAAMGGYTVRWGDTLSGLAATSGVPLEHIATMNGLDPAAPLLAGTVVKLPTGSPAPAGAAAPAPSRTVVPAASPEPTPERVDAAQVQQIAAANGVSPSLAAAIAWQESGFNNSMVSSANARGVMQIMPGTWSWVEGNLAGRALNAASAADNVHAGTLYLRHLLEQAGGDEATAIAGYYQGLGSVRSRGLYEDTERYIQNVQALRARFGGG